MNEKLFGVEENRDVFICRDCQKKVKEAHVDCSDESTVWSLSEWEQLKNASS